MRDATAIHRRRRRSLRGATLAIVAALAMGQLGAFLHFSLVGHAFSLRDGTLVHCDEEGPQCPRDQGSPPPLSRHETCEVFAALHQASAPPAPGPSLAAPPDFVPHTCPSVPDNDVVVEHGALYLLAPSHSPPSTSV